VAGLKFRFPRTNFSLLENFLLVQHISPKIQNLALKIPHLGMKLGDKIKERFSTPLISSVGNSPLSAVVKFPPSAQSINQSLFQVKTHIT